MRLLSAAGPGLSGLILFLIVLIQSGLSAASPSWLQPSDEDQIRQIRQRSNRAITERDLDGLRQTWVSDVVVAASSGTVFRGSEEMAEAFHSAFQDPTFVTYVRTPESVEVSRNGRFAAERGQWQGVWNQINGQINGQMKVEGSYQAQWIRVGPHWKIRAEVFVALYCSGSTACPD